MPCYGCWNPPGKPLMHVDMRAHPLTSCHKLTVEVTSGSGGEAWEFRGGGNLGGGGVGI